MIKITVSIKLLSVVIALLLVVIFFQTGRNLSISQTHIELLVPAVLIALLGVVGMFFVINQVVIRPLNHLSTVAQKQLSGDRSARVEHFPSDEFGHLGRTFNELSSQIDTSIRHQEQIIEAHTRAIETSSNVSRRLSTILDQDELVMTVVNEVQLSFNYYHAQIYLVDENRRILVMVGGTGEAGRIMLSRGHNVPVGRGLVGRVAEGNSIVLVPDTTQDPNWLPNPLLPETRSEIALPIAIGDQVLGVLDIQHYIVNGFAQQDEDLLRSIANQVAIAIQNARSFMVVQKQAEQQELINRINQQIQMATSVESVLQIAARELGSALDARQVSAHIGRVDSGENQ